MHSTGKKQLSDFKLFKFESGPHKILQQILRILPLNLFKKHDLMALHKGADAPVFSDLNQMLLI